MDLTNIFFLLFKESPTNPNQDPLYETKAEDDPCMRYPSSWFALITYKPVFFSTNPVTTLTNLVLSEVSCAEFVLA